ncbi:MAG: hypothetical protein RL226_981, partial [Bacteroidota bacterium]
MQFRPGDKVRFLNDVGEATVVQMISNVEVLVVDESGFDYPYPADELVKIDANIDEDYAYKSRTPETAEVMLR